MMVLWISAATPRAASCPRNLQRTEGSGESSSPYTTRSEGPRAVGIRSEDDDLHVLDCGCGVVFSG